MCVPVIKVILLLPNNKHAYGFERKCFLPWEICYVLGSEYHLRTGVTCRIELHCSGQVLPSRVIILTSLNVDIFPMKREAATVDHNSL